MSGEETDDDNFYDMENASPTRTRTPDGIDEARDPPTPAEEFDENFYEIEEETHFKTTHPYIDEPLSPCGESSPNFHYLALTQNEYVELMMRYVDEVKEILQLPSTIVKLLLHHFKWNKQRLLERFYESTHERFFQEAKIINPFAEKLPADEPVGMCSICYTDEPKDIFSLECRHAFCSDCWKNYLINQVVNEGQAQTIVCPDSQCDILVDEETAARFLASNEFVKHLYNKIILNAYVSNNPRARWCPGKGCGHIISARSLTSAYNYAQLILCDHCKTSFCFQCAQPWHDPIKCFLLLQWNKTLFDDSYTAVWLKANTKCCPKCHVNIEKNGGCNHMTCRKCSHEFCWLCFGKWSKHVDCNRYNQNENSEELQSRYSSVLSRYMHYYDRFRNHEHSLTLESKSLKRIRRKLSKNEQQIFKNDIHAIERAFRVLLDCRRTLIYTYPFAYYLQKNNQSIVFEENQADLERICEELTGLLEQCLLQPKAFENIRKKIIEKSQYCEMRKVVLLNHVKEGYKNNYWQYQDEISKISENLL